MRQLARIVSLILLAAGGVAAFSLILNGLKMNGELGGGGWLLIGGGIGVFCSVAATACVLSILASIDERLRDAGWLNQSERDERDAAQRRSEAQGADSGERVVFPDSTKPSGDLL